MDDVTCRSQHMVFTEEDGDWCMCWLTREECPYWKFVEEPLCEQFTENDNL